MAGAELKAIRRKSGYSQTQMGQMIECSRHAVSYWECQGTISTRRLRYGVPKRMGEVLGFTVLPYFHAPHARGDGVLLPNRLTSTRTRGDGVLEWTDAEQSALDREVARLNEKAAIAAARYRQLCGSNTRKGNPCRNMSEPGRRRCKFHGGRSTGPKTPEGKARIADAQKARWAAYRAAQGS
ncbi:hypothetical protein C1J02_17435 [Sulfitobacter sp. SK011]|nr:hypothetical protein C1J02_17435 [Sulfitobacter sp. SK011]